MRVDILSAHGSFPLFFLAPAHISLLFYFSLISFFYTALGFSRALTFFFF